MLDIEFQTKTVVLPIRFQAATALGKRWFAEEEIHTNTYKNMDSYHKY